MILKAIGYFLLPCIVVLGLFRVGGAVSIHDDATIVATRDLCRLSGTPLASDDPSSCTIVADMKRTFIKENYLLRLKDGRVIEVPRHLIFGHSYQRSYYSLSW